MNNLRKLIVSGLGAGYLPVAPGTWGSVAPCVLFAALAWSGGAVPDVRWLLPIAMGGLAVLSSVACVELGPFAEATYGRKDPRQCVIDEWAGQAVALFFLPLTAGGSVWIPAAVAFVAFRAMDILKPPPARRLERLPFGWGVLLDDLVAGAYANVISQLILRLGFHA
ncbi:MAG: phosphatidylglycerophosphatase A [Phycisphaerae bacterium]|jgi:phosphatidylglycerophosphatase A